VPDAEAEKSKGHLCYGGKEDRLAGETPPGKGESPTQGVYLGRKGGKREGGDADYKSGAKSPCPFLQRKNLRGKGNTRAAEANWSVPTMVSRRPYS